MGINLNIFLNKKILIYGLGKSGISAFYFLKNKNDVCLYDDSNLNLKNSIRKYLIHSKNVAKLNIFAEKCNGSVL